MRGSLFQYHIGDCVRGCQVYLTYAQDKDGMADKVNGPITILIDDDNKITWVFAVFSETCDQNFYLKSINELLVKV